MQLGARKHTGAEDGLLQSLVQDEQAKQPGAYAEMQPDEGKSLEFILWRQPSPGQSSCRGSLDIQPDTLHIYVHTLVCEAH